MDIVLPLAEMSISEKLALMDFLGDDLSKTPEDIPVPSWHLQILQKREESVKNGSAKYIDWEIAKKKLLEDLS